jgi:4-hydroxyacetophenone monooxygenase
MSNPIPIEPITADDAEIRVALADADIASLLPTLAHLTGDLSLLRPDVRPNPRPGLLDAPDGLTDEQRDAGREIAFSVLRRWRDEGTPVTPPLDEEALTAILRYLAGENTAEYLPFLIEELALDTDPGAPAWRREEVAPGREFTVAIIGAGMSGLVAAHRLAQAAIPYVIVEKNDDVGGTWLENHYPGCRVDVANHLFSYSFAQRHDWPQYFSAQGVLLDYFRAFADDIDVRPHIRFGTEVVSAVYDEGSADWTLHVRTPDRTEEALRADAVISAVGQLNRPSFPDIAGHGTFAGPSFHSARWDDSVDLTGKRVAVIGTGASAFQFIPEIAERCADLTVFQRTPPWLTPTPEYHEDLPAGLRWLFGHVPHYVQWYRFWLFCKSEHGLLPYVSVDPSWDGGGLSVSAKNAEVRELFVQYVAAQVPDDPELLAKLVPDYPPGAKRMLRDNGTYVAALRRDDVHLVTDPIERITPDGVVTRDAGPHTADMLIYATGFSASHFLTPMKVIGRDGVELHDRWNGDARAYLGITVPGFPNFFTIYGPNTNIVVNGSIIFFSECAVNYITGCLKLLLDGGHRALECRPEAHDRFNTDVDAANKLMAWGASTVHTWYRNALGRISQNWPYSLLEYWRRTKTPDPADFRLS